MAVVGSLSLSRSEAVSAIQNLEDDEVYFVRSRVDRVELGGGRDSLLTGGLWEVGRVFNEDYEIRWRPEGEQYRITVLTEMEELPSVSEAIEYEYIENGWHTTETEVILWGQYRCYGDEIKGFVQVQIPGFRTYPDPWDERWIPGDKAAIRAVNYSKDGVVLYTRFKGVAKYVG